MTFVPLVGFTLLEDSLRVGGRSCPFFLDFPVFSAAGQPPHSYFQRTIRERALKLPSLLWPVCFLF